MWIVWAKFILCVIIIFFSGRKVAKYGDIIAEKTGLGGFWIGVVLLAWVTSLPELFTGISAIIIVDAPDITIGNLFGANTFNLLNLALLDIAYRNGSLIRAIGPGHRLTGWFCMVLVLVPAASIFISRFSALGIGWIGWYTPIIILLYLFFIRKIFLFEQRQPSPEAADQGAGLNYGEVSLGRVYRYFTISAVFVIGAGIWLAIIGDEIALATGWGQSFVGSLFIAFTTALPEITVSFTAMRMGAIDMAVANMIGSNLLNMTIISIDDLIYLKGPVLASVSESHLITALAVMLMLGVFIAGLRFKPKRLCRLSWFNTSSIAIFLSSAYLNFSLA